MFSFTHQIDLEHLAPEGDYDAHTILELLCVGLKLMDINDDFLDCITPDIEAMVSALMCYGAIPGKPTIPSLSLYSYVYLIFTIFSPLHSGTQILRIHTLEGSRAP